METESPQSPWTTALTMLFRPRLLLQGTVEYLFAWSFTRGWWRLLLVHSLPLLLLLSSIAIVGYGLSHSRRSLIERYDQWAVAEIPEVMRELEIDDQNVDSAKTNADRSTTPASDSTSTSQDTPQENSQVAANADGSSEKLISPYGDLLLRRLLQLQDSSSRITYLVAAQLARQERIGQAKQMMRRVAPEQDSGFPPAHAWLAIEQVRLIQQRVITPSERNRLTQQLIKDLETAVTWNNCPEPLRILYADWLESQEGNTAQAMNVLEQANAQRTSLTAKLKIAEMALKHDQTGRFRRAAEEIKQEVKSRRENESLSIEDLTILANLFLLEQDAKSARETAQEGLSRAPNDPRFRRLISEAYRVEYLASITNQGGQTSVNLSLLDAALRVDPTNPGVGLEIARLQNIGQDPSPELRAALEMQLSQGQATALTHILLANRLLVEGNLAVAEPHLEVALRQAPNNPTIMNNLALVLARTKPEEIKRALELSVAACQVAPSNATFRDTLGEIRALSGDNLGAIESYESAIGLDPKLIATRERLVQLYRQLGMKEMADVQQRALESLLQPSTEIETKDKPAPAPATAPESPAELREPNQDSNQDPSAIPRETRSEQIE